jgi:hypothetical protein
MYPMKVVRNRLLNFGIEFGISNIRSFSTIICCNNVHTFLHVTMCLIKKYAIFNIAPIL